MSSISGCMAGLPWCLRLLIKVVARGLLLSLTMSLEGYFFYMFCVKYTLAELELEHDDGAGPWIYGQLLLVVFL